MSKTDKDRRFDRITPLRTPLHDPYKRATVSKWRETDDEDDEQ